MALIGFDRLDKSDTTPKLTSMFLSRPSHISETSWRTFSQTKWWTLQERGLTLLVDALAFTTPRTSPKGSWATTNGVDATSSTS